MNLPEIEQKILKFWDKKKIFEKLIRQRKKRPFFSFYDGPPFATGKPHYGHILVTTIKDTVLRYFTMRGYRVPRRVGWDCHGLPVENLIEKELGIKNKKEIEKYGIEKFNAACRASVFRCLDDFEKTLKRVGRWADYSDAYTTLDNDYIESVWWVLKQLWDKGLVYKDYRVCPYCPRCGTPLSNFEVNQGYRETKSPSVFVKFLISNGKLRGNHVALGNFQFLNSYFLAWTTTPWTLPGNVALAVHPQADYVLVKQDKENYILAKKRLAILKKSDYQIIKKFKGKDLVGLRYEPLFDYLAKQKIKNINNAFQVLPADFVLLDEGTGIVHTAVMYGDDDFWLGKKFNLPFYHTVDENGCFKKEVVKWAGKFIKKVEPEIIDDLEKKGLLYKKEKIIHSYPFCWRCETPLLYYALESWYIAVTKFKKQLVLNNKKIHWVPSHVKKGRFGQWLEEARDWAFSRNRFWGAPLPIWKCEKCKRSICIGSLKELKEYLKIKNQKSKVKITSQNSKFLEDLHRPYIDKVVLQCHCGGKMKRVEEVFDCWFESGSMPYAQWHYPFKNKKLVEDTFPADFIAEGIDQTRGWFYTLHVLATGLTLKNLGLGKNQPAFLNVVVNGLILDPFGRKLSKRLKNYPEPEEVFNQYGADSLRYFLLASTPIGEDYRFSEKGVEDVCRRIISTFWHTYLFFETYGEKVPSSQFPVPSSKLLDQWIVSRLNHLNHQVVKWMDQYELTKAARLFDQFIDDLSNWYIRRSRRRFQKPENAQEKKEACQILYYVLLNLAKLIAPFTPFIAEEIYQKLTKNYKLYPEQSRRIKTKNHESVHLCDYPKPNKKLINKKLEEKMKIVRQIVNLALAERAVAKIKIRQPLQKLKINPKKFFQNLTGQENKKLKTDRELLELIKEEINVKKIVFDRKLKQEIKLDKKITRELKEEGMAREIVRQVQEMRKKAGLVPKDKIITNYELGIRNYRLEKIFKKWEDYLKKETNSQSIESYPAKLKKFDLEKEIVVDKKKIKIGIKKIK